MTEWKHSINSYVINGEKRFNGKFEFWGLSRKELEELLKFEDRLVADDDRDQGNRE